MYFWNYKILAEKLHHNQLSEKDKFKYLLMYTFLTVGLIFIMFQRYLANGTTENLQIFRFWQSLTFIMFCLAALFLFYKYNQKGDGKYLIERYIILSLPIMIKATVISTLISIPLSIGLTVLLLNFYNLSHNELIFISMISTYPLIYALPLYYLIDAAKIASGIKKIKES